MPSYRIVGWERSCLCTGWCGPRHCCTSTRRWCGFVSIQFYNITNLIIPGAFFNSGQSCCSVEVSSILNILTLSVHTSAVEDIRPRDKIRCICTKVCGGNKGTWLTLSPSATIDQVLSEIQARGSHRSQHWSRTRRQPGICRANSETSGWCWFVKD